MPQTNQGNLNFEWAYRLIDGLCSTGVTQAVISPGSRSTPLVLACDHHSQITPHVVIDERCAAFYALGLAKSSGTSVVLIATSGSAPAHWLPAVIEASHSKIPLILLTADRPPELQGTSANQTTEQNPLFSGHVRLQHNPGAPRQEQIALQGQQALGQRAAHQARWPNPGPVHLNLPFAEPLLPENPPSSLSTTSVEQIATPESSVDSTQLEQLRTILQPGNGIIVCGPMANQKQALKQAIKQLAEKLGAAIFADPLSGLRWAESFDKATLCHYDSFLKPQTKLPHIQWILRLGAPPVSKTLQHLLQQNPARQIVCDPYGEWPDPFQTLTDMVHAAPLQLCKALLDEPIPLINEIPPLLNHLQGLEEACGLKVNQSEGLPIEASIVRALFDILPSKSIVLAGNSMPIRHIDSWSDGGVKEIQVVGNRGVSGIDGHLSTLAGLAQGSEKKCVALVGDLTFYHDMNGLAALQAHDVVIVLLNNNGGGIFGYLPQSELDSYQQYWSTPMNLDFGHAAALYGLHYQKCDNPESFAKQFTQALNQRGPQLIEVTIDREQSVQRHKTFWQNNH